MSKSETELKQMNDNTYSKIEFNKNVLFIKTLPNQIGFDSVKIKNTGKTCVYFKWQKEDLQFKLEDKKSDGIDRFYCHYSDSKIFPDEEKTFTFCFFSEKNGQFSEDWILATSPPLHNCNLRLHLNGMVHKYVDLYSEKINELDNMISKRGINTAINECVLDLIESIKEDAPPLPDMRQEKVFKFYYEHYNKEYNVVFSKKVMKDLAMLNDRICDAKGIDKMVIIEEIKEEKKVEEPKEEEEPKNKKKDVKKGGKKEEEQKEEDEEAKRLAEEAKRIEEEKRKAEIEQQKAYNEEVYKKRFWNGSIDELKAKINTLEKEEDKTNFLNMLDIIIHQSRKKRPEDSDVYGYVKNLLLSQLENFNDISNEVKEEYQIPPYTFDLITRESLSEQELQKYELELKKKKEDYNKKSKKKAMKPEEEQAEMEEYKAKLFDKIKNSILDLFNNFENERYSYTLKQKVLGSHNFDEEYIERLCRVKTLRSVKNEGGIDNKYVVLRIDIENYKREYVNDVDEEGNVIGQHLKSIDFMSTKDKMLDSLNYLLNNGVKAVLLLLDFGPKNGVINPEYSTKELKDYIETAIDHPTFYAKDIEELLDYNQKIEDEELKDNCCIIMENLNFFPEECGFEQYQEEFVNPNGKEENLCLYHKNQFITQLTSKPTIFINDSIFSFDKYYPTIIDVKVPLRVIGSKIEEQLKKITDFFSIDSKQYLLIIGDNDNFRVKGRDNVSKILGEDDIEGDSYILNYDDIESLISNLLIINSLMLRFKEIYIFGKLALHFLQFVRKDYTLFDNSKYKVNEKLFPLMKYILVKAYLNDIKIVLPCDFKILEKGEYLKHLEPMLDSQGFSKDYTKEIKTLLKRERIQRKLEATYTDEDELNENADYVKVKLEEEQIEHLKLYKEKTVIIDRMPYCYDFIQEFDQAQGVSKPRKIFKTPMDIYLFNESIYDKEIIYPEEVIHCSEHYIQKENDRLEKIRIEEEEKKKAEEEAAALALQQEEEAKNAKKNPIPSKRNSLINNPPAQSQPEQPQGEEQPQGADRAEGEEEKKEENPEEVKVEEKKKKYDPRVYDYDTFELVDYGEKTYENLISSINTMNGVMWLGRLSPSKLENLFDNYPKIIEAIHNRKKVLKEKFEEDQATQEKKINETELKARKQLLNIFLKSKSVYEYVKDNFKNVLNNSSANPIEELGDEEEVPQDEEQFNHDMHVLIDYFINDDFDLINSILKGEHISGLSGVDMEKPIVKEEDFDPKSLDEITN